MTPLPSGLYTIEAWNGGRCVWFTTRRQARTVERRAMDAYADYGGRVIVRSDRTGRVVAEYDGFWR